MNWKVLLGIGAIIVLTYQFLPNVANYLWVLVGLACPISMVLMMSGMNHAKGTEKVYACPKCGLSYRSAARANKCGAWCSTNSSSNPEITRDAIEHEND